MLPFPKEQIATLIPNKRNYLWTIYLKSEAFSLLCRLTACLDYSNELQDKSAYIKNETSKCKTWVFEMQGSVIFPNPREISNYLKSSQENLLKSSEQNWELRFKSWAFFCGLENLMVWNKTKSCFLFLCSRDLETLTNIDYWDICKPSVYLHLVLIYLTIILRKFHSVHWKL